MTISGTYDDREEMEHDIVVSALMDKLKRVPGPNDLRKVEMIKPALYRKKYMYFEGEKLGTITIKANKDELIMLFSKK